MQSIAYIKTVFVYPVGGEPRRVNIQQFLEHHGITSNPFAEEEAQSDPVFKQHCIDHTYHPAWDKIYGDPAEPSTSMVFGEKGAGKTAIRLQIVRHLLRHNQNHRNDRMFIVEYDDFNPFLDRFASRLSPRNRRPDRVLTHWKLWDHMDAILSLAVTGLVDRILEVRQPSGPALGEITTDEVRRLDRHQARDLLLLAACYDQSSAETFKGRWHRLRRRLRFRPWKTYWDFALGAGVTLSTLGLIAKYDKWEWLTGSYWVYLIVAAAWTPRMWRCAKRWLQAIGIVRHVRTGNHQVRPLRQVLMNLTENELGGQPLPNKDRTDDRFELLSKLQGLLRTLGFSGMIVLVDRVDEPHLINGSADQMRALLWPMLDNKFLKHAGLGLKLLLPIELSRYIDREDREFHERARLDKQNMIPSLEWTGESLYDVANARLKACSSEGKPIALRDLFDDSISDQRLIDALRTLRVPRHMFKFMYRLLVAHCNAHTESAPSWQISSEHFESTMALYSREQDAVDRGFRAG